MESISTLHLLFRDVCSNVHGFRYAQYTKDPDMERDITMYMEGEISYYLNGLASRNVALTLDIWLLGKWVLHYILGSSTYLFSDDLANFELEYCLDLCGFPAIKFQIQYRIKKFQCVEKKLWRPLEK